MQIVYMYSCYHGYKPGYLLTQTARFPNVYVPWASYIIDQKHAVTMYNHANYKYISWTIGDYKFTFKCAIMGVTIYMMQFLTATLHDTENPFQLLGSILVNM